MSNNWVTVGKVFLFVVAILGVQAYRTTKEVTVVRTETCTQTATETLHGFIRWDYSTPCPVVAPGLSETAKKLLEPGSVPFVDQDGNVLDRFLKKD